MKSITNANLKFEMKKLRLKPGDLVTFNIDMPINHEQCKQIREMLNKHLPDGIDSVILSMGASIKQTTRKR